MDDPRGHSNWLFPTPARVAAVYLAFSATWILCSDRVAQAYFSDESLAFVQSIKGLFFISLSAGLIFLLLSIAHRAYAATLASERAANAQLDSIDADLKSALELRGAILEMLPVMITILDHQGTIRDVNRAWRAFSIDIGTPRPGFSVGLNYMEAVSPVALGGEADRRLVEDALNAILAGKSESFSLDFPVTNEKGRTRWFEVRLQAISVGAARGAIAVHGEITDRKMREASIVLSDARFNALAWSAPYGVVVARNDTVLFANRVARKILSMAPEGSDFDRLSEYFSHAPDGTPVTVPRGAESRSVRLRVDAEKIPWADGHAELLFVREAARIVAGSDGPRMTLAVP